MLARRVWMLVGALVVTVLLIGVGSYAFVRHMRVQQAELKSEEDRRAAEAEANRKLEEEANRKQEEAGKQQLAAEQESQARAAAEAEAKRTEPSPILTRRSDLVPRVLTPIGTEVSCMCTKAIMIEPLLILTRRSDSTPTMLSPFAIEES
jgi:hypothetical protein